MKYRTLGKTGEKVSILGFGAMRLPHFENNNQINVEESDKILSYGIENGINLVDTAGLRKQARVENGVENSLYNYFCCEFFNCSKIHK